MDPNTIIMEWFTNHQTFFKHQNQMEGAWDIPPVQLEGGGGEILSGRVDIFFDRKICPPPPSDKSYGTPLLEWKYTLSKHIYWNYEIEINGKSSKYWILKNSQS